MFNKYSIFITVAVFYTNVSPTQEKFYNSTSTETNSILSIETNSSILSSTNTLNSSHTADSTKNILFNLPPSTNSSNITTSSSISFESDETTEGLSELAYYTGNSTEDEFDDLVDPDDYNCTKNMDYYVSEAIDLTRLRNKLRYWFLELGEELHLGADRKKMIKMQYKELVKLETVIAKHIDCVVKKEKWSWDFPGKIMRILCGRRLKAIRNQLSKKREIYFKEALNENKNDEEQLNRFNDISGVQERMDILEKMLNLKYVKV